MTQGRAPLHLRADHPAFGALALVVGLLTWHCPRASADSTSAADRAAAEALFEEGGALFRQGQYEAACAKLAASQRLDPAVGTLLNLGRCYEKVGRTASAWVAFLDAAAAAKSGGQSERERLAREAAARLAPTLPRLRIDVPAGARAPGLIVSRDGAPLSPDLWNNEAPVDPGEHEVRFSAPHKRPAAQTARAQPGEVAEVTAPVLADEPLPEASPISDTREGSRRALHLQRAGVAVGALGIAGVVTGVVFGLIAKSDKDRADRTCSAGQCADQAGQDANDAAHRHATIATVATACGAAALAGGAALFWFGHRNRPSSAEPASSAAVPVVNSSGGGVAIVGRW